MLHMEESPLLPALVDGQLSSSFLSSPSLACVACNHLLIQEHILNTCISQAAFSSSKQYGSKQ